MTTFSFVLRYVNEPAASARFYNALFGLPIVEQSPTFAMLPLSDGVMLGLWKRDGVEPKAAATGSDGEIAFTVADRRAADDLYADWRKRDIAIAQAPTAMDFGYTLTALDPDGHRVRVLVPGVAS